MGLGRNPQTTHLAGITWAKAQVIPASLRCSGALVVGRRSRQRTKVTAGLEGDGDPVRKVGARAARDLQITIPELEMPGGSRSDRGVDGPMDLDRDIESKACCRRTGEVHEVASFVEDPE